MHLPLTNTEILYDDFTFTNNAFGLLSYPLSPLAPYINMSFTFFKVPDRGQ
jgi:hypothetical protein